MNLKSYLSSVTLCLTVVLAFVVFFKSVTSNIAILLTLAYTFAVVAILHFKFNKEFYLIKGSFFVMLPTVFAIFVFYHGVYMPFSVEVMYASIFTIAIYFISTIVALKIAHKQLMKLTQYINDHAN